MTSAKNGSKNAPKPSPAKKTSTVAATGRGKKRTKQEDSESDEDEVEEEEENDEEEEIESAYGDDSEEPEDDDDEDDSDDDDFQSSDDVRTRKSAANKAKASSSKKQTTSATKSSSSNPAKKAKTSSTTASPKKPTTNKNQSKPEPTKTFLVSPLKIPRPKGGHPVADAIQPETLEFLRDLKLNNDREYMMLNQERCDQAKADFLDFIRMVKEGLLEADPDVMDQEPKQSMMRIHRDIRFSNDKTPYKDHFSCFFSKGGKKSIAAGYYFGVGSNGETFVGCGAWDIGSAALTRVRHGIVDHADRFNAILATDAIKRITGGKTGIEALREGHTPLKTGPKGFDKDHPMIEFLKKKSFAVGRKFEDRQVVNEGFLEEVLSTFDACVDLVHILNDWIG
ncbi:hypothetical protein K457DRAFT_71204 [Linnemannia elongata AG-77]|uniref:Uncharacterized protein n=1 Tax=Linnemannia elongata AG-77 TaxID=1314771 RepID=A0A197K326_9FUNG|nr:hypothetical protein K457DRAFT_71204 [Linnemannia elongata AG-77]